MKTKHMVTVFSGQSIHMCVETCVWIEIGLTIGLTVKIRVQFVYLYKFQTLREPNISHVVSIEYLG